MWRHGEREVSGGKHANEVNCWLGFGVLFVTATTLVMILASYMVLEDFKAVVGRKRRRALSGQKRESSFYPPVKFGRLALCVRATGSGSALLFNRPAMSGRSVTRLYFLAFAACSILAASSSVTSM
jgi:hypothetical protein